MRELIERMRAVAARTNDPLLLEAAAALEAAREDASRWRDRYVAELSCYRMDLHGDTHNEAIERARATAEKIAAIDQARGKGGGEVEP
jgi:hypothetical protein